VGAGARARRFVCLPCAHDLFKRKARACAIKYLNPTLGMLALDFSPRRGIDVDRASDQLEKRSAVLPFKGSWSSTMFAFSSFKESFRNDAP